MGKDPAIFSAAIFKNQIPSSCFITDVVEATRKQYNDNVIDCIQLINGIYRFDFLNKQVKLNFLSRGLKLFDRTIPVMDWYVGLDSPKVRVVIGGLPRETPDYLILEALTRLGVEAVSKLEHDYYRDKVNGGFLKIKTGRRAIMINKPPSPLPQNIMIGDREASIRHWGQIENKNQNVNSLTKTKDTLSVNESQVSLPRPVTEMPNNNAVSGDHDSQPLPNSQSLILRHRVFRCQKLCHLQISLRSTSLQNLQQLQKDPEVCQEEGAQPEITREIFLRMAGWSPHISKLRLKPLLTPQKA